MNLHTLNYSDQFRKIQKKDKNYFLNQSNMGL